MLYSLLERLNNKRPFTKAQAHCDVPCGIYDPAVAQISALTVIRMVDLIKELEDKGDLSVTDLARLSRLVGEKEAHAVRAKEEVRIIWGDYFKQPQFDQVANVNELVHNIMMHGSKVKQGVNREDAVKFLSLINEFAEAFWLTKGVKTYTAACPYPPAEQVVYPQLG